MLEVFIGVEDHGIPCLEHSGGEPRKELHGRQAPSCETLPEGVLQVHRGRTQRIRGPIQETLTKAFYFLREVFL